MAGRGRELLVDQVKAGGVVVMCPTRKISRGRGVDSTADYQPGNHLQRKSGGGREQQSKSHPRMQRRRGSLRLYLRSDTRPGFSFVQPVLIGWTHTA